ncbi:MAG: FMN-binding protein [Salinivirgaceae bacterium]|nr:FMN-binding protein [Salinivirgaceae bacterium]
MKIVLTILIIAVSTLFCEANGLVYNPKLLQKELAKKLNADVSLLKELPQLSSQSMNTGKFFKVVKNDTLLGYVYVGRVVSCRAGGCSKDKKPLSVAEHYEYFDAFMIFNSQKVIESVRVFNYQATHGQEVCSKGWLKQFKNFSAEKNLVVGKDIDSISGATISANALTNEVNYITQLLMVN